MTPSRIALVRAAGVLLLAAQTNGQTIPSVEQVLAKVADTYRAPQRYLLSATITARTPELPDAPKPIPVTFAIELPDKMRMEGDLTTFGVPGFNLWVMDGETGWAFDGKSNQFYKFTRTSPKGAAAQFDGSEPDPGRPEQVVAYFDYYLLVRYRGLIKPAGAARIVRTERLSIAPNNQVECFVVQIDRGPFEEKKSGASRNTWWVDKDRYLVWKEDRATWLSDGFQELSSTTFQTILLDEPLPKDIFVFTPPKGATLAQAPGH
jgi:outer membrane lipoprotein-sorting protein